MAKYQIESYDIVSILNYIKNGEMAVPEIQRPFVWKAKKVRDLIDSLYNGYPVGYLIIWQNPNIKLKDGTLSTGKKILIDGQQRVSSLMVALLGYEVLDSDFKQRNIKIAFNPLYKEDEEKFEVQTPVHINSKQWVEDISIFFENNFDSFKFIEDYIKDNKNVDTKTLSLNIQKIVNIKNSRIGVIVLSQDLEIDEVTEIFVRINSKGKSLNEADFVMSKIASDLNNNGSNLRKAIDYFCHLLIDSSVYDKIKKNDKEFAKTNYFEKIKWLTSTSLKKVYLPNYNDMLRVSFMHIFKRGKLSDLVSLLSGRDFKTKTFKEEIVIESFYNLHKGISNFIDENLFNEFLLIIETAGFLSNKLINSKITLDFSYTLFLILKKYNKQKFSKTEIEKYIKKWYVLSTLTSRYISSPESKMDRDIRNIDEKGFINFFNDIEKSELSNNFWSVTLPQRLETSAVNSPYFNVFLASQIYLDDCELFSNDIKIKKLIELGKIGEIHHIFPKQYLIDSGISDASKYNQVANFTCIDKNINKIIGKRCPQEYFSEVKECCNNNKAINKFSSIDTIDKFNKNLEQNCIPNRIFELTFKDYDIFLLERRKLMANKIKLYYNSLG